MIPWLVLLTVSLIEWDGSVANSQTSIATKGRFPDRFVEVSERIFSGAQPKGEDQYASLATMGIRTIVSVDGAIPDVATASKFGLRYVHIPIGYDGISSQASNDLAAVGGQPGGAIFVHCHHGRHRGPAAAVVVAMALGQIDNAGANQVLTQAGTGRQYAGLWRDVANYKPPLHTPFATGLVEKAETSLLVRSMSQLGRSFESFTEHSDRSSKVERGSRDKTLSELAWLVEEGFKESMRAPEIVSNIEMARQMNEARILSHKLRRAVDRHDWSVADRLHQSLKEGCVSCHKAHRN